MMARRRYSLHAYIGDPLGVAHMTCIMGRFVHILICIGSDILYLGIKASFAYFARGVFSCFNLCVVPREPLSPYACKNKYDLTFGFVGTSSMCTTSNEFSHTLCWRCRCASCTWRASAIDAAPLEMLLQ